jgi:hypothetical protein
VIGFKSTGSATRHTLGGGFVSSVLENGVLQDITELLFAPLTERTGNRASYAARKARPRK